MDFSHYTTPRDADFDAFIEKNGGVKTYQVPLVADKKALQTKTNAVREEAAQGRLKALDHNVEWYDVEIPASDGYRLPTRVYKHKSAVSTQDSPLPIFHYIHGGGFIYGTLRTEDYFCVRVVEALYKQGTPCVLVNAMYRHTPDYTFPRIQQDGIDAFEYISANPKTFLGHDLNQIPPRIIVGGISAGGGISTAIVINELERSRAEGNANRIAGAWLTIPLVLCLHEYPAEYIIPGKSSFDQPDAAENVAGLRKDTTEYYLDMLSPDSSMRNHKWLSPMLLDPEQLKGFPRCTFQICGADPLRDGGLVFAQNLKEKAGVDVVEVVVYNGLPHAFFAMPAKLGCIEKFFNDTVRLLQELL